MSLRQPLPLDVIQVASPCKADWNDMSGDDNVRHCRLCQLNVYNLSGLTREAAEALIVEKEGNLCVRFFRRPDGTLLTADCPVAWWDLRMRLVRIAACLAALVSFLSFGLLSALGRGWFGSEPPAQPSADPFLRLAGDVEPPAILGKVCAPPMRLPLPPPVTPTP